MKNRIGFWTSFFSVALFSLLLLLAAGCSNEQKTKKRPNILFLAIDDLRPELGLLSYTIIKMIHLKR